MGRSKNSDRAAIFFRAPKHFREDLDFIARRSGETRATVLRQLIADAVERARSGQRILRAG